MRMDVNRNNNGTRGLPSADRTEADFAAYSEMPELLSCSNVSGITPSVVRRTAKGTEKETKTVSGSCTPPSLISQVKNKVYRGLECGSGREEMERILA